MYFEFNRSLQHSLVKCVWLLQEPAALYNADSIVPDSYVELIVNCGAPLVYTPTTGAVVDLPRVFLKGIQKSPLPFQASGQAQLVGVRLYPWAIPWLFGCAAPYQHLPIMPLTGRWLALYPLLTQSLRHGEQEAAAALQTFLSDHLPPHQEANAIQTVGSLIYAAQGLIRIHDLASRVCLSISQFERTFKHHMGLSPKAFTQLVRFEAVRDSLIMAPHTSLTEITYMFGYTDQAHFIRDFKAFAHCTPGAFVQTAQQNAEFLQSF